MTTISKSKVGDTAPRWYEVLALDQQRAYEGQLKQAMLGLEQPQEQERAAQEQTAQIKLGALRRILSTLVFQLRILDLDAIEDKQTRTIPLKVPVKVIKELLEELDSEDEVRMEWPVSNQTTEVTTATQYPWSQANYSNIYTSDSTVPNNQLSGTTKKGV